MSSVLVEKDWLESFVRGERELQQEDLLRHVGTVDAIAVGGVTLRDVRVSVDESALLLSATLTVGSLKASVAGSAQVGERFSVSGELVEGTFDVGASEVSVESGTLSFTPEPSWNLTVTSDITRFALEFSLTASIDESSTASVRLVLRTQATVGDFLKAALGFKPMDLPFAVPAGTAIEVTTSGTVVVSSDLLSVETFEEAWLLAVTLTDAADFAQLLGTFPIFDVLQKVTLVTASSDIVKAQVSAKVADALPSVDSLTAGGSISITVNVRALLGAFVTGIKGENPYLDVYGATTNPRTLIALASDDLLSNLTIGDAYAIRGAVLKVVGDDWTIAGTLNNLQPNQRFALPNVYVEGTVTAMNMTITVGISSDNYANTAVLEDGVLDGSPPDCLA